MPIALSTGGATLGRDAATGASICDFSVTRRTYSNLPLSRLRIATVARLAFGTQIRAYERENRKPERGESLAYWPGFLLSIVHLSQSQKFRETATRTTGCDEDEAAFEKRLKKIAKAKVSDQSKPRGRKAS
jgi:hypothetical protein